MLMMLIITHQATYHGLLFEVQAVTVRSGENDQISDV